MEILSMSHPWLDGLKLLFSEQKSDYEHYQFPYAIWAVPGTWRGSVGTFSTPASCRRHAISTALSLPPNSRQSGEVQASSETAASCGKGAGIEVKLVPRDKYDYTPERRPVFSRPTPTSNSART